VALGKEYDQNSLFLMFLKFYHHLHPFFKVESSFAYKIDEKKGLNIFETVANTNKSAKEFVIENY
jgi:hypothetical protein